ncbi:hypothetical protein D3Y59_10125 [Hymenobacter oligotrophus]|uniref:Uncharacterized protein n=1 Tax=Hymenobacter oligotrophus TaxID=2319843 RepID=A0A3B7RDT1_9BACT|nr:hypothetical protein [Hymenobacter oligotrophus]AYA37376.1 hypothetical protein D3Y59_10125 [Hymenobacter oligotrophus]
MIKKPYLLLLSAYFYGCQQEAPAGLKTESYQSAKNVAAHDSLRLQQLLRYYPEARLPLKLSTEVAAKDTSIMSPLPGEKLVPDSLTRLLGIGANSAGNDVFAVSKLLLSKERVGLFTRVPGEYDPSKIKLSIVNTRTGQIDADFEVAETYGDAGVSYVRTTDVIRTPEGSLQLLVNQANCWPLDEELSNIKCVDSSFIYKFGNSDLRLMNKKKLKEY